jgi:ribosomal protein S18 acetylase RimI-like enzyme
LLAVPDGVTVFVAETASEQVVGLVAIDERDEDPLLVGPLLWADQLADLFGHALLTAAVQWAEDAALPSLLSKLDLEDDHALNFFMNQGFKLLGTREVLLVAPAAGVSAPDIPDGLKVGLSPDMLSSDYLQLYGDIGIAVGWRERLQWTRPQVFEHLQRPDVLLFAVRAGTTYLGFAELEMTEMRAEIRLFGVLPAFRGRGVGRALLGQVLFHVTHTMGLDEVTLRLQTDETGCLAFEPTRYGFRQDRVLVYLEKPLSGVLVGRDTAL